MKVVVHLRTVFVSCDTHCCQFHTLVRDSTNSQRRKQAMKLLQTKRGLSRFAAILFGLRYRAASFGWLPSIAKGLSIVAADTTRTILKLVLKVGLLYPIRLLRKSVSLVGSVFAKRPSPKAAG
jgi:hypothetical protein